MAVQLVDEFDIWRPGYDGSTVTVFVAGTTSLASLFSDEALTLPLDNPQVLATFTDASGNSYGKFSQSVYVGQPYYLDIDSGENTGIQRPGLTSLDGQNAGAATVTVAGSAQLNTLSAIAGRTVYAANYGEIVTGGSIGSAASNTAAITAAIGALGTSGVVHLPAGVIRVNAFTVPAGVILQGEGESATTLQIVSGATAFTLSGDYAGFRDLTIDGSTKTLGSRGIYGVNRSFVILENVMLENLDTGATFKGANNPQWKNFSISNCNTGVEMHGDRDAGNTNLGGAFVGGQWLGGTVFACATIGVDLDYIDAIVAHTAIENIYFNANTGTAVRIRGAQFEPFNNCRWSANTTNVDMLDDLTVLTPATQYRNKVNGIAFNGGLMSGGKFQATGNAGDIVLDHLKLLGVTFNLIPTLSNNILLKDCFEDSGTVVTGDSTKLVRQFESEEFEITGLTLDNAVTRAWGITLENNQCVYFQIQAIGVQRNGTNRAIYHAVCGGRRAVGTLLYQNQTANFTLGDILTGATSGAIARIVADSDSGATGTLSLGNILGTFANGEIITGSTTGSAQVNGTVADGTHAVDSVGLVHLRTAYETDSAWDISLSFSAGEVAFNVQGNSSQTVDWTVRIKMLTN